MCDGLSYMGILRPSTSARADPRASQINKHMRIHACIMYLYVYTERLTITHTRVDVYTIGTTRTHIKSCPSRPPPTHTPCNIEPCVHARASMHGSQRDHRYRVLRAHAPWRTHVLYILWHPMLEGSRSSHSATGSTTHRGTSNPTSEECRFGIILIAFAS